MTTAEWLGLLNALLERLEEPVAETRDLAIAGPGGPIPARLYRSAATGTLPVLVFFHGGGWVVGDIESHDTCCRHLANRAECAVVSVDYRLAPEHKFPAAVEDCLAATAWVAGNAASRCPGMTFE